MVGQLEGKAMKQRQAALSSEMRQFDRSPFDVMQSQSASSYRESSQFKLNAGSDSMQFDLEAPKVGKRNRSIDADFEIKGVGTDTPSLFNKTVRGIQEVFSDWLGQGEAKGNSAKRRDRGAALNQDNHTPDDAERHRGARQQRRNGRNAGIKGLDDAPQPEKDWQRQHTKTEQRTSNLGNQLRKTPDAQRLPDPSTSKTDVNSLDLSGGQSRTPQQPHLTNSTPNGTEVTFNAQPDSIQFDLNSRPMNGAQSPIDIDLDIQGIGTHNPQAFAGTFREINNLVSNVMGYKPSGNSNPPTPEIGVIQPRPGLLPDQRIDTDQPWKLETPSQASEDIAQVQDPSIVRKAQPLIGVIDSGFAPNQHGDQVRDVIAETNPNAEFKLAEGVGQGKWAENLSRFVETAQASGRPAVANLSFDLSNVNPDGSVSTRKSLTPEESKALAAAQKAGIPVVVSAGNQGESSHAWQQAAQQFDNVIVTGASDGNKRAAYSSYGSELDILALGQKSGTSLTGTSLAAAETTATVANLLSVNPDLKAPEVEKILKATATNPERFDPKQPDAKVKPTLDASAENGSGLLNPASAFTQAAALEKMEAEITAKTGVPDQQISVKAMEATHFPNSSLGQPEAGEMALQVVTPGFNVTLGTPERDYQYKANTGGGFKLANDPKSNNQPIAGSSPTPQPKPADPNQAISGEKPGKPDPVEPPKGGSTDPKQALLESAKSYLHVREQGNNRGTEVEKIQRSAGGKPGDAWCMEFVQHVVKDIETKTGARSNIKRSNRCRDVWEQTPKENRLSRPEPGSLVIWKNHVGIIESVSPDGKSFKTIEGNTTNPNNKNEQGVFEKDRKLGELEPGNPLLGFVKVF